MSEILIDELLVRSSNFGMLFGNVMMAKLGTSLRKSFSYGILKLGACAPAHPPLISSNMKRNHTFLAIEHGLSP